MVTREPSIDCLAAREAASARVDGELSELEGARLDGHLLGCVDCRLFAAELASIASVLRCAAPEQPSVAIGLTRPRRIQLSSWAAAASLLLAVTGSSFALGHAIASHSSAGPLAAGQVDVVRLRQDSAHQHVLALLNAFALRRQDIGPMRAI